MKMTRFEKRFVNRKNKADVNIKILKTDLQKCEIENINTVLELGCGIGFVSKYLADSHDFNVYGTDFDAAQIKIANEVQPKSDRLHFRVEDAAELTFEDSSIDLVVSQNVFHHIPNWEDAIGEVSRVLHSDGYIIWLDFAFPGIIKNIFRPFVKNYGLYTISDIKSAFEVNGLKSIFYERLAHGPFRQHHFVLQKN